MLANITVREIKSKTAEKVNFESSDGKRWNCNKPEIMNDFTVGERYHIDYNESSFSGQGGKQITMKWINRARAWKPEDGENTWPDKEPYNPNGNRGSYSGGGKSMGKSDYDPEVSKRQTAANCAGNIIAHYVQATKKVDLDEINVIFPTLADIILKFVDSKGVQSGVADAGSKESPVLLDDDDIEF